MFRPCRHLDIRTVKQFASCVASRRVSPETERFSFTPCFSWVVVRRRHHLLTVLTVSLTARKPLKRFHRVGRGTRSPRVQLKVRVAANRVRTASGSDGSNSNLRNKCL